MSQAVARDPIQEFVQSAAVHIRKTELFYGWMILLSTLLFSIFLFVLVDHWVWEFNRPVRLLLWAALAMWSIWWFIRRILPPMRYRIHPEYAARQFELQDPRSKDSLISWIQLNQSANTAPKSVLNFVGRFAFGFLRNSDASQVADNANLIRLSAAFFGCLLCTMIYFFASPKSGLTSAARMLMPWANIAPATRVQFAQITPGATTIMQGGSIPIDVTVKGLHKNEKVYLRYDLSDGQVRGQTLPLKEEIQGINYKLDFGKDSGGVHQPMTYWIHAGDAVAGPFEVQIQIVPLVAIDHIDLTFPPYTNLKPRSIQQQGHFEAPEGTIAHISAIANQEMKSARIEFDPVLQNKLFISAREFLDMKVDKTQLDATWTATIDRKNSIDKKTTSYRIHGVNHLKESNHDPVIYQIKIIPDLPPEVEFTGNSIAVELPVNQALALDITARDPDYGLTSVMLQGVSENKLSPQEPKIVLQQLVFQSDDDNPRTKVTQYFFIPKDHGLKVGDEIDLIAIAQDNYHNPISQKLEPQKGSSQPLRIRVVEPEVSVENGDEPKDPQKPSNEPQIAQNDSKKPNSRVDWSRFRENNQQSQRMPNSSEDKNGSSKNGERQPDDAQSPRSGQGGTDSGNDPSGSKQNDPNAQISPSSSMPNGNSDSLPPDLSGNPQSSNNSQNPNSQNSPNGTSNQSPRESKQNDQKAFEKIQQFMKENQQDSSSNGTSPADNNPSGSENTSLDRGNTDKTGTDKSGTDKTGTDKSGNDKSGSDKTGTDKSGTDKSGNDKSGNDKSGTDKSGTDKTGMDKSGTDKSGTDKSGTDKTGTDKTGTDKTGTDKSGTDKSGTDKTGTDKTGTDKTGSDKTGSDKTGTDKSGTDKTGTDKSGTDKSGTDKSGTDKSGTDKSGTDKSGTDKSGTDKSGTDKTGTDKTGTDKTGTDKTGTDKTGTDKTGTDKTGTDKSGTDKSGTDKSGTDKSGTDKSGTDKSGTDKSGTDKSGMDKTGNDKSGNDKSGNDKSGTDKSGSDKTGTDKTGTDKTGTDKTGTDKTGTDKTGTDKTGTDKTGTDKTGTDKTGTDKTGTDKTGTDKSGNDKSGNDKSGTDKSGSDKSGSDKTGTDKTGTDKTGTDKTGTDKTGTDKTGMDKTGNDKSGSDKSGNDKSGSDKTGMESQGDGQGGQQGSKGGESKSNQNPQKSPERKSDPGPDQEQGQGKGSGDQQGGKQGKPNSNAPNSAGSGLNNTGNTPQSSNAGSRGPSQSAEFGADAANQEYSRRAADLLLDYIDRQRDQPDPELLKRLNWNADDFRKFADRWREAKEQAKLDPNKRAELDDALRNLGLVGTGQKINRLSDRNDGLRGMQEEGGRLRPPESLREQFEAFRKAAGKLGK